MDINVIGRTIKVSEALKNRAENKLAKLSKFFGDDASVTVALSTARDKSIVEATIFYKGMIYRAQHSGYDMYASIDRVVEILERQIRKNRTRLEKRLYESAFAPAPDFDPSDVAEEEYEIVKSKKFTIKPMSVDEAILQMNMLGHQFFVFKSDETGKAAVIYKRNNGGYGLIETE